MVCYMKTMNINRGFSLIEVMIIVAIVAVLAMVVVPSMKSLTIRNRMVAQVNFLHASLSNARIEAIKRGENVVMCKSGDPTGCPGNAGDCCTTTGDWSQGWVVFMDNDGDNKMIVGNGDILVKIGDPLYGGNAVAGSGNAANWVRFNRNGFATSNDGDTFTVCNADDNRILGRTIFQTGRIINEGAAVYTACN